MPVLDPKVVILARRGETPIASLVLMTTDGDLRLHCVSYTDETIKSAMDKTFELLGVPAGQQVKIMAFVMDIPKETSDAKVLEQFSAAVNAKDTAYFYSLVDKLKNSQGGQA